MSKVEKVLNERFIPEVTNLILNYLKTGEGFTKFGKIDWSGYPTHDGFDQLYEVIDENGIKKMVFSYTARVFTTRIYDYYCDVPRNVCLSYLLAPIAIVPCVLSGVIYGLLSSVNPKKFPYGSGKSVPSGFFFIRD